MDEALFLKAVIFLKRAKLLASAISEISSSHTRGDNFSPRMPCQWYLRQSERGWGGYRDDSDWSVRSPTPFGMAFETS
jgi:hypothetical protein